MNKREYFDELACRWDRLPAAPDAGEKAARFVERMVLGEARRVLDVGCGTGVLVPHLRRALPNGARIVQMDFALQMLREGLRARPVSGLMALCADARRIPLAAGSVDAVLCYGVLPHLGDMVSAVRELLRVLRPGGSLGVGHAMDSAALNALHAGFGGPVAADVLPPAAVLGEILGSAGAYPVAVEESPGWYFVRVTTGAS
jgi:ubiquinone/menaquinone biosynthesis C-methylase UbiE